MTESNYFSGNKLNPFVKALADTFCASGQYLILIWFSQDRVTRNKSKVKQSEINRVFWDGRDPQRSSIPTLQWMAYRGIKLATILWPTELISGNTNNSSCFENKDSKVAVLSSWCLNSYYSSTEENALATVSVWCLLLKPGKILPLFHFRVLHPFHSNRQILTNVRWQSVAHSAGVKTVTTFKVSLEHLAVHRNKTWILSSEERLQRKAA